MSKKTLAIFFAFGTIGALRQTILFSTKPAYDVLDNRITFALIAGIITLLFLVLAIRFWRQAQKENNLF